MSNLFFDFWLWVANHWHFSAAAGGLLVTVGVFLWKKILKQYYDSILFIWKNPMSTSSVIGEITTIKKELSRIVKQIEPNGGSSIPDVLNRLEHFLQEHHKTSLALHDLAGLPFWKSDSEGACTYASAEFREIIGNEGLGFDWFTSLHKEDRESVRDEWLDAVKQKRRFMEKYRFQHADSRIISGTGHGIPIYVEKNGISHFVGFVGTFMVDK